MSGRFFHRGARLVGARPIEGSFFGVQPNAIEILAGQKNGLKLTFKIVKQLGKEPNTCEITIYNLNEQSKHHFAQLPLSVRLDVGYDGELSRLFTGDLTFGYTTRDGGVDWKTVLQCHDGGRAYNEATISKTYKGPVDKLTLVKATVESMGLRLPTSIAQAKELAGQLVSGVTLHGPSRLELSTLLKPHDIDWSIQDGSMQILRANDTRPDTAYVISQANGMIESPEYNAPKKPKDKRLLKVKTLIKNTALGPGSTIKVESNRINGFFRIEKIECTGDTESGDWVQDIEAQPLR